MRKIFLMEGTQWKIAEFPNVRVTVIAKIDRRMGAKTKWKAVLYRDQNGVLSTRDEEEFRRFFEKIK